LGRPSADKLPTLESRRLILRAFTLADAPTVQTLAAAFEIADTTGTVPHPYPKDGAVAWISTHSQQLAGGMHTFAIERKDEGNVIGVMALGVNSKHDKGEIAYWVGVPFWNQGFATEAARRIVAYGFDYLGLNRIFGRYCSRNPASRRVMEKAGLRYEATLRQDFKRWDKYEDMGVCAILRSEFGLSAADHGAAADSPTVTRR